MQIEAAWVFFITCHDLHSWFVWTHHIFTSGQKGQGRLKYTRYTYGDLYYLLWYTDNLNTTNRPKGMQDHSPHVAHNHVTEFLIR